MASIGEPTRIVPRVEHPVLAQFNHEFSTHSDLSRYDQIRSSERSTSPVMAYLNLLQTDFFISTRIALLIKNNLHDLPFITQTTRSLLYDFKQRGIIGEACFTALHEKIDKQDFLSVFRTLYVLMLYSNIANAHNAQNPDPNFAFESAARYSDKLVKTAPHLLAKEEQALQTQSRKQFLKNTLLEFATRPDFPVEIQHQILPTVRALDDADPQQFRAQFMILLEKFEKLPELEKICWKELENNIAPYQGQEFIDQTFLRLKTENYYKNCIARVTTLKQSLERTNNDHLLALSEKCKKAYNGCIYLLGDSKNMAACSQTRFAALIGKMRTEWQSINNIFNRATAQHAHNLCACQVQTPPAQHKLATWPFNSNTLIDLKPAQPVTAEHLINRGMTQEQFTENQKKTVAILGCKWGGGHMEVARGIANNLETHGYHPITVDLPEVLMSEDPIRNSFVTRWLGKDWSMTTLFDGLIKAKAFAIISFLRWLKSKLFPSQGYSETELKLVMEQLLKLNPDSVITTYSAHNESIIQACKILGIPCIHVATDVDNTIETRDAPPDYNHFKMALPFNVPEAIDPVLKTTTAAQRVVTGPPVRHAFTHRRTPADIQRFKEKWGIDTRKKVVVVSSGKNGDFSPYAEMLAKRYANKDPSEIPIHVVAICGSKNQDLKRHLEQNVSPKSKLPMTISLSYSEEEMEELMSMASYGGVLVGKAGGATIFETFARGTRILVDKVRPGMLANGVKHFFVSLCENILRLFGFHYQIYWEKANMNFAKKHGLAQTFRYESDFFAKLDKMLDNDGLPVPLNLEVKNVEQEIPKVLEEMLAKAAVERDTREAREIHKKL